MKKCVSKILRQITWLNFIRDKSFSRLKDVFTSPKNFDDQIDQFFFIEKSLNLLGKHTKNELKNMYSID